MCLRIPGRTYELEGERSGQRAKYRGTEDSVGQTSGGLPGGYWYVTPVILDPYGEIRSVLTFVSTKHRKSSMRPADSAQSGPKRVLGVVLGMTAG